MDTNNLYLLSIIEHHHQAQKPVDFHCKKQFTCLQADIQVVQAIDHNIYV